MLLRHCGSLGVVGDSLGTNNAITPHMVIPHTGFIIVFLVITMLIVSCYYYHYYRNYTWCYIRRLARDMYDKNGIGGEVRHGVTSAVSRETSLNKHVTPHLHREYQALGLKNCQLLTLLP